MAGNSNSGNVIDFRLSDEQLAKKIEEFRREYGDGKHGIVTWPRFCTYIGYSEIEVRECYLRGKEGKNAYNTRSKLLERFATECRAMTAATGVKQQMTVNKEVERDYLNPTATKSGSGVARVVFGNGDGRFVDALK